MTTDQQPTAQRTVEDDLLSARRILADYTDRTQCATAVQHVAQHAKNAGYDSAKVAYLELAYPISPPEDAPYEANAYDSNGDPVCHGIPLPIRALSDGCVPEAFRPNTAPPGPYAWEHPGSLTMALEVAKVEAHDFDTDARATKEQAAFDLLGSMWSRGDAEYYVLTRDYLAECVAEEALGREVAFSPAETAAAADAIMRDGSLDAVFAAAREEVARLVQEQVGRRVRAREKIGD